MGSRTSESAAEQSCAACSIGPRTFKVPLLQTESERSIAACGGSRRDAEPENSILHCSPPSPAPASRASAPGEEKPIDDDLQAWRQRTQQPLQSAESSETARAKAVCDIRGSQPVHAYGIVPGCAA